MLDLYEYAKIELQFVNHYFYSHINRIKIIIVISSFYNTILKVHVL